MLDRFAHVSIALDPKPRRLDTSLIRLSESVYCTAADRYYYAVHLYHLTGSRSQIAATSIKYLNNYPMYA